MSFQPHDGTRFVRNLALLATATGIMTTGGIAQSSVSASFYIQSEASILDGITPRSGLPSDAELNKTTVLLLSSATPWSEAERARIDAFIQKGGGLILLHDAIVASGFFTGEAKRWSGELPLFFTPQGRGDAVTGGISNFDVVDEMMYGLDVPKEANVLATTWTPNRKHLKGTDPQPYVYGVSPIIWTMEKGTGRIVCVVPGKESETLEHPAIRVILARALGWSAKLSEKEAASLVKRDEFQQIAYPPGGPLAPRKALESLVVHPDFKVEEVAHEPLISKPLNIDWDGEGQLWVVESVEYPEGRQGGGPESMYSHWQRESDLPKPAPADRPAGDKVSWLEDTDGDGIMDKKHVFADNLDLATSFCFYKDGIIVAQPPEILFLRDKNKDGKADERIVLYTGLGTFDRHAVLNNLRWGLDGWIYSTHGYSSSPKVTSGDGKTDFGAIGSGIVRFRPDGSSIEMVSAKSGNCWGFEMTSDGELFFTQPTSGDLVMHVPVSDRIMAEAGLGREPSWNVMVHMRPVKPLMTWEEIVANQPNDVIGSFTAACGTAIYEGGAWPKEWNLAYFTAEPTVHIVHHEAFSQDGVTYKAEKTREAEFSATRDFWSRPIDTRIGPDGQLYVIDFYNQAILHNDPRGPIHLWNHQAARPDRDHFFGRIHRYSHRNSQKLPVADMSDVSGQVAALSHPNREVRFRAQRMIEEGDVKAAGRMLTGARGPAAIHALWVRAAAGLLTENELISALKDTNPSLNVAAARVIAEHPTLATANVRKTIASDVVAKQDPRVRLQWLAALPAGSVLPPDVLVNLQAKSSDRWTRAAIARLARNIPSEVLAAAMNSKDLAAQAPLSGLLFEAFAKDEKKLASMLDALASQDRPEISVTSLAALRQQEISKGPLVAAALEKLAANKNPRLAAAALPLVASQWNEADQAKRLPLLVKQLVSAGTTDPDALSALATLPFFSPELSAYLRSGITRSEQARGPVLKALIGNSSIDSSKLLLELLPTVSAHEKAGILESLLGRPASAILLSDALEIGHIQVPIVGPQVLARLAEHPDEKVRAHAAPMVKRLLGATEAKSELINRLLPQVSTPGDPVAGKALYAACAVCHVYQGEGTSIGPVLEGMGAHGIESLLTHIIDPNREVEPSYHTWNITTSDGNTVSGFISRETADTLFIRHAGGEIGIPRDTITSRIDTGRSLMPEGFESLGADNLRDLIAYLRAGEQRFHIISLAKVANSDGSRGIYMSADVEGDRVSIKNYGHAEVYGVPFNLPDPRVASLGKNVVVLEGGAQENALSRTMPRQVEIQVGQAAARLHLLGGVAGWGFPAFSEKVPVLNISVQYSDGSKQDITLVNGVDIADHVAGVDVPGSARTDITEHGQMRYLWRNLDKPNIPITKLVISSNGSAAAPMIAGITLESAAKDQSIPKAPDAGGPAGH